MRAGREGGHILTLKRKAAGLALFLTKDNDVVLDKVAVEDAPVVEVRALVIIARVVRMFTLSTVTDNQIKDSADVDGVVDESVEAAVPVESNGVAIGACQCVFASGIVC